MKRALLILAATIAIAGAACGGEDETPEPPADEGETTSDCVDLSSGDVFELTIVDFAFEPSCLTAKASQSITITNQGAVAHTFTIEGTQIDVEIGPGKTFNGEPVTGVVEPGTYTFMCRIHPAMTGEITVL